MTTADLQRSSFVPVLRPQERALLAAVEAGAVACRRSPSSFAFAARHSGSMLAAASAPGAVAAVLAAYRDVPAYRAFLDARGGLPRRPHGMTADTWLNMVPTTSKKTYVDPFTMDQRCVGGTLPVLRVEIDESSGSSGTPYQWARSHEELAEVHTTLALLARHMLGDDRESVTLNAFSMGAWSTGVNVTAAMRTIGAVKSCGPEADKVLDALSLYGTRVRYAVCGYPPFLQQLLHRALERGIDLSGFDLVGFVGGEGMGEGLRAELERTFSKVWSAYGASDLDIGVASETPVSVWLRQVATQDPSLAEELFGRADRLPMVFQYDPASYHVTSLEGELVVTVLRDTLSPKLRYQVGDAGGTVSLRHALSLASAHGYVWAGEDFDLPLLYVHGRADSTVSFMGANLYPEDIAAGLEDAGFFGAFILELRGDLDARPVIHVESTDLNRSLVEQAIRDRLASNSADYRAALAEDPRAAEIAVELHAPGTGVFAANASRIKRRYVIA